MKNMSVEALRFKVLETDVFAEVEPIQKQLIILALKKAGNDFSTIMFQDAG